ncbi:MAG TPA: alpha-1,4-glucan--maltose-1-phosphate maltosyltransferase [Solirubrobacteraceae bacterium]|nr:alpha-1,4-glucan--maltose-1-phosphate maltosyltransferase [Solirubrobacteraceae bacterium]
MATRTSEIQAPVAQKEEAARRGRGGRGKRAAMPARIVIQYPTPSVDDGGYAAKRCAGDTVHVEADIFRDGHELLRAVVRYRGPSGGRWQESQLRRRDAHLGGVRWAGSFEVEQTGRYEYTIEAWTDVFGTWRDELERKLNAGQHDLAGELSEGDLLLRAALDNARSEGDRKLIEHALLTLSDPAAPEAAKHDVILGPELLDAVERTQERHGAVSLEPPLAIEVDRIRARFGAWYELFPRSWGGFAGVQKRLPDLAEHGFDVVYLPPIHPIGHTNRKGRDNALVAGPKDPGSPWAIGDETGGHDSIHPDLGTEEELRELTQAASKLEIDIALDFAIQASADHPWLAEHPEWFHRRPDGTLKYAENPPKRYQDIYNFNWESPDWRGLWDALLEVVLHWVDCGVKVFRVDNPHTKPFAFWAWLIEQVHARDRDVIFLAEAFTRRSVMRHLAKVGFSQSYTYFTWKNSRWELAEYVSELAYSGEQEYFRPNFFTNTPDILHAYLQHGGRPAFEARLILAATLSPSYGIYSGYEAIESVAAEEGSEEYLHSEKYEIKKRKLKGELLPLIKQLNFARRENPALQHLSNVTFLDTANDGLIAYAKQWGANTIVTVVSIDPHQTQEGVATIPASLGLPPSFSARDLLTDERYQWRIGPNYVRLEPGVRQAHVVRVES